MAADVPRTFEALKHRIVERRSSLPRRLMQVAVHALDRPDDIAFGTAASIAAAADVQPSTLVRFAQHFGYEGFSDLQRVFRDRLRERNGSYEERLAAIREGVPPDSQERAILEGFVSAAERSLGSLRQSAGAEALESAVRLLADARTIYLVAQRRAFPITSYIAYAFGKLGVRSLLVGSPLGIDAEQVAMAARGDAAIAVSFSPYAPATLEHARSLAGRSVPIVAITDSPFSPLAGLASIWFEVAEADYAGFRSLSAGMALAMTLTVAVAERRLASVSE